MEHASILPNRPSWSACLLTFWTILVWAPGAGAWGEDPQQVEFFEDSVRPLLETHCLECHGGDERGGGLSLESSADWQRGGDSGSVIVVGDAEASLLVRAVRYTDPELQMPPSGPLTQREVAVLEEWIRRGAIDPREGSPDPDRLTAADPEQQDASDLWSLRPVQPIALPQVADSAWVRNPIDAFILARLESAGLHPAPAADKTTWIRRVTFDLIGLPPTPDEVASFLADDSPAAWQRVVDRLLASPHYGERWGRHWLDVARYADSNGLDENLAFGTAWRYRDYVFDSFNEGKPFDRFIVEQIAGDLVPGADRETKTATGFLVLGAKVLAEPDREKLLMDTIDEQIDTTGKAFLGLTLGCARCHDHKFDPILQSDYYALAAIFKSTKTFGDTNFGAIKHWHEYSFADLAELEDLKVVEREISEAKSAVAKFKNESMAAIRSQAKQSAAKYLAASAEIPVGASLVEIGKVAEAYALHPRILHHCRSHLEFNRGVPFFQRWHSMVDAGSTPEDLQSHYEHLFARARDYHADPKTAEQFDADEIELMQHAWAALEDASGFLAVPPKPEFAFDDATLQRYHALLEVARVVESNAIDETSAMGVREGTTITKLPIHIRGSHRNLGRPVERGFPQVLQTSTMQPILPRHESGRLELAKWITSGHHPLTARVAVNRIWGWHFGDPLVRTTENFGVLSDPPSHPELLDWLAREFVETGWSVKQLQRMIVLSNSYRMASTHPDAAGCAAVDAENRLRWAFPIVRLQAEQIRDAILAVSGRLDTRLGGKMVPLRNRQFVFDHTSIDHTKYDSVRRAAYLPVIRNNLYTFFEQFDFPDPTMPTGNRSTTVVAPQALLLMNDDLVIDSAASFAARVCQQTEATDSRIESAYRWAFGRLPSDSERLRAIEFISESDHSQAAWQLFCHSLLASNEFIYVR
jgi:hypothetical protein